MKFFVLFAILIAIVHASCASVPKVVYDGPIYELRQIEEENIEPDTELMDSNEPLLPLRHRRVTCDVLSWQSKWLSINHSACAIRCLAQRRKGGSCRNGVCICRK
ncbi:defensin-2 precursor [Apis mellifera caucasica]|uniref:Defensin-2 n=2 Tax=Apis mellifera TaxID=7460 RepID=DEF2_APIME|nr:defensin-2 precursor [Apis mellifera]Q5MQL3.1 RecName: Full=Defensin-2; Flags: Precursor [Apis mellifera]AAT94401.1 defensin 2 [Apis mellifera]KAG6796338.1 defensin-2 precursor [Apis mellifera caucasica]|eukprot:NP_001011638.1 defensin-2 precursor [Apis mellifera]